MKEKVDLAKNIIDGKLLPTDWIYHNVFHLSEDQFDEYRDQIAEDQKRIFRFKQIENEGNDPLESGKSYGTPHDLAALYGASRYAGANLPDGYDEDLKLGRPSEKASSINTQDNVFGNDRLGNKGMKKGDATGEDKTLRNNFKGGSPLTLETRQNKTLLENLEKKISIKKEESSLLDESQIRE